ncbi:MAG: response regulator [Heliobacteriaceae bacterium]|nr:response regulator [Heliobacteriaceae bacterium]MDD4587268.1 response regulator [Heliobacteriaceae bacterium]
MRVLIAEDDLASRKFLYKFLSSYGDCDITVDGIETVDAFLLAWDEGQPYDLICLDIMMPKLDGIKTLKTIRELEKQRGLKGSKTVKIIMTTALNEPETVFNCFDTGCEAFAAKPIDTEKMLEAIKRLGLLS